MSHIRDKSVREIMQLFGTLKPSEAWKLIGAIVTIILVLASGGFYVGTKKLEAELGLCKLTIERRTNLLSEAYRQSAGNLRDRIKDELSRTGGTR